MESTAAHSTVHQPPETSPNQSRLFRIDTTVAMSVGRRSSFSPLTIKQQSCIRILLFLLGVSSVSFNSLFLFSTIGNHYGLISYRSATINDFEDLSMTTRGSVIHENVTNQSRTNIGNLDALMDVVTKDDKTVSRFNSNNHHHTTCKLYTAACLYIKEENHRLIEWYVSWRCLRHFLRTEGCLTGTYILRVYDHVSQH